MPRAMTIGVFFAALFMLGYTKPAVTDSPETKATEPFFVNARQDGLPTGIFFNRSAGDHDIRKAAESIDVSKVESIIIKSSQLTAGGLEDLKHYPKLKSLLIDGELPLAGFPRLPGLISLSVTPWQGLQREQAEAIAANTSLTHLKISAALLEDGAAEQLGQLPNLHYLYLSHCQLNTVDCSGLAISPSLTHLDLSQTGLTHEGIVELSKLSTLESLSLQQAKIRDESLQLMSRLPALKELELDRCEQLTDAGIQTIWKLGLVKASVPVNASMTKKCISGIKKATELKWLTIAGEWLDDDALDSILALPKIESIYLFGPTSLSKSKVKNLRKTHPNVRIFTGIDHVGESQVDSVAKRQKQFVEQIEEAGATLELNENSHVQSVRLVSGADVNKAIKMLAYNDTVGSVSFDDVTLTEGAILRLRRIKNLKFINFHKCSSLTDRMLLQLTHIPIETLSLRNCPNVTDNGLKNLGNSKTITSLRLEDLKACKTIPSSLTRITNLKNLKLQDLQINEESLGSLPELSKLEQLEIRGCAISGGRLAESVIGISTLNSLTFGRLTSHAGQPTELDECRQILKDARPELEVRIVH